MFSNYRKGLQPVQGFGTRISKELVKEESPKVETFTWKTGLKVAAPFILLGLLLGYHQEKSKRG